MEDRFLNECRHFDDFRNDTPAEPRPSSRELLAMAFESDFSWAFRLEDMLDRIEGQP